jgi:hypothetical protein
MSRVGVPPLFYEEGFPLEIVERFETVDVRTLGEKRKILVQGFICGV